MILCPLLYLNLNDDFPKESQRYLQFYEGQSYLRRLFGSDVYFLCLIRRLNHACREKASQMWRRRLAALLTTWWNYFFVASMRLQLHVKYIYFLLSSIVIIITRNTYLFFISFDRSDGCAMFFTRYREQALSISPPINNRCY